MCSASECNKNRGLWQPVPSLRASQDVAWSFLDDVVCCLPWQLYNTTNWRLRFRAWVCVVLDITLGSMLKQRWGQICYCQSCFLDCRAARPRLVQSDKPHQLEVNTFLPGSPLCSREKPPHLRRGPRAFLRFYSWHPQDIPWQWGAGSSAGKLHPAVCCVNRFCGPVSRGAGCVVRPLSPLCQVWAVALFVNFSNSLALAFLGGMRWVFLPTVHEAASPGRYYYHDEQHSHNG